MIGHFKYQISTGLGGDPSFFMKLPTLTMTQDGTLAQILHRGKNINQLARYLVSWQKFFGHDQEADLEQR